MTLHAVLFALMLSCLILVATFLSVVDASNWWKDCDPNSIFQIDTLSLTPDPPLIGEHLDIVLNGTLTEEVNKGTVDFTVKLAGVKIFHLSIPLESVINGPARPGFVQAFRHSLDVPKYTPPAKYGGKLLVTTEDEKTVLCLSFDNLFLRKPSKAD